MEPVISIDVSISFTKDELTNLVGLLEDGEVFVVKFDCTDSWPLDTHPKHCYVVRSDGKRVHLPNVIGLNTAPGFGPVSG